MMEEKLTPVFLTETEQGLKEIDAEAYRISSKRQIPLNGKITSEKIEWVIRQCDLLMVQSPSEPVTIFINSDGGLISAAYHLIDYISCSEGTFFCVAAEICASAAAQIFASFPKGGRLIMPHCSIVIHRPLTASSYPVNSGSVSAMADALHRTEKIVYGDLARWTGQSVEKIAEDCEQETWLRGQEAVDYGFADEIYSERRLTELEYEL